MSLETAARAVGHWPIDVTEIHLVAERENTVYCVTTATDDRYALRLHRKGYQRDDALWSELVWTQYLSGCGIPVADPVPSRHGRLIEKTDGYAVDLLDWLDGKPLGVSGGPLQCDDRTDTFFALGEVMARIHVASDAWTTPDGFTRSAWDLDGLIGEQPLWGRYLDNPALTHTQRELLAQQSERARAELSGCALDYGLIHADLVCENVLVSPKGLRVIDFDDSGFGYRLFDLATALLKHRHEPDFAALKAALIDGYRRVRPLDTAHLPAFLLLRAQTYVGWIRARIDEPGARERQTRLIATAVDVAREYKAGSA